MGNTRKLTTYTIFARKGEFSTEVLGNSYSRNAKELSKAVKEGNSFMGVAIVSEFFVEDAKPELKVFLNGPDAIALNIGKWSDYEGKNVMISPAEIKDFCATLLSKGFEVDTTILTSFSEKLVFHV